jgi:hypothetical protein
MAGIVEARRSTQVSTQIWGLTMAYTERRERKKGVRYRGLYKAAETWAEPLLVRGPTRGCCDIMRYH